MMTLRYNYLLRRISGLLIFLPVGLSSYAQILVTGPLSGANTTGSYYHPTSITLAPGFSTAPGGTFYAYIGGSACLPLTSVAPSNNQNYILTSTMREGVVTDASQISSKNICEVNQTIRYIDGLGRPVQDVQVMASGGNDLKDVVQHIEYDAYGRESKQYLPYADPGAANGSFRSSALGSQNSFYNSPPSGVVQIPSASGITPSYSQTVYELSPLNRALEQGAPGATWQPSSSGISGSGRTVKTAYGVNIASEVRLWTVNSTGASGTAYYGVNQLTKTTLTDENGSRTIEFKDKEGRVVLKQAEQSLNSFINTYYVYDDLGNLKYVIPPGFTATSFTESAADFLNYIYAYRYDGRRRVVEKKIPGKGWEELVYNKLDQVILSRDANQAANSKWLFTKYDALGRTILTGVMSSAATRVSMQTTADGLGSTLWESRTGSGTGYTNTIYPISGIDAYLTINYYDDYSFYGNSFTATDITPSGKTRGLLTGTKTNILGSSTMLLSTNYYDDKGNLIQSKSQNHLSGGTDLVNNTWRFNGELISSTRVHVASGVTTTIATRYEYDQIGRKKSTYQKMNSDPEVQLSLNEYNAVGQLKNKSLHDGLQATEYAYNPRGWLKTSVSPQFSMELKYENGTTPKYNGNITNQVWTNGGSSNTFTYGYDMLNRLTSGSATGMSETITYNTMGNIVTMKRDALTASTYSYTGNRLNTINGTSAPTLTSYLYDANGNATTDGRNNRTISYNILNLPLAVSGSPGVTYTYDGMGNKLKRVVAGGATTDYIDGVHYTNGTITFIQTEEGIARRSGTNYSYEYNLKDHLGNTRATFYRNPVSNNLEILQRDDYYPFGKQKTVTANTNKYLYNGKELQDQLGQYDYGARFYDPVIGRWNVVDPSSEQGGQESWSQYHYVFNNPIKNTDPDGRCPNGDCPTGNNESALFNILLDIRDKVADGIVRVGTYAAGANNPAIPVMGLNYGYDEDGNRHSTLAPTGGNRHVEGFLGVIGVSNLIPGEGVGAGLFTKTIGVKSAAAEILEANKIAGKTGEDFLKNTFGGAQQVSQNTSRGRRVTDNLTTGGIAQESKVGRTSLTSNVKTQISKDVELINNPTSPVRSASWHFFPGKTGVGPTKPLQRELDRVGIPFNTYD